MTRSVPRLGLPGVVHRQADERRTAAEKGIVVYGPRIWTPTVYGPRPDGKFSFRTLLQKVQVRRDCIATVYSASECGRKVIPPRAMMVSRAFPPHRR